MPILKIKNMELTLVQSELNVIFNLPIYSTNSSSNANSNTKIKTGSESCWIIYLLYYLKFHCWSKLAKIIDMLDNFESQVSN